VIVLDTTVVNVALAAIGDDLGASVEGLQWVVDGYVVVFAALLLSCGSLSDRLGATRAFAGGLIGFTLASVACGLAPTLATLLIARVVQGVAAAVVLPSSLALVRQAFDDPGERARAIGLWAAGGGVAIAAGPVVGGLLTGAIDWRAIFFLNVPVGLLGLLLLARVPASAPRPARLDLPGQIAAVVAVGALALGVIEEAHWVVVLAILAGAVFVAIERRVEAPMLPLGLFRSPVLSAATVAGFALNFSFYGLVFVLSLFFQRVLDHSPAVAGLLFLPLTGLVTAVNVVAGRLTALHGARRPLIAGQLILGVSMVSLVLIDTDTPLLVIELLLVPISVGGGLIVPPLTSALLETVDAAQAGLAAGVLNAARQLGSAVGVAVFGALLGAGFVTGMHRAVLVGAGATLAGAGLSLRYVRAD
jgi:DHA2 family methylenomycin A resistance protein-like MFS transporter